LSFLSFELNIGHRIIFLIASLCYTTLVNDMPTASQTHTKKNVCTGSFDLLAEISFNQVITGSH